MTVIQELNLISLYNMKLTILMATSIDGVIGEDDSQISTDWTSAADKKSFVTETKKHGVIIMGNSTFKTIGRPLPGRLNFILTSDPEKYQDKVQPGILEFFKGNPEEVIKELENRGFESAILGGGARTNASFLKDKLVDEIVINIHPIIFGQGLRITEGTELNQKLELLEVNDIGDQTVQLKYKVLND